MSARNVNECEFVQIALLVDTHLVCEPEYAQFLRAYQGREDSHAISIL